MAGCRDCRTCTRPGKGLVTLGAGALHFMTLGISYAIKRTSRHCPQCGHKLTSHARRADGSFAD